MCGSDHPVAAEEKLSEGSRLVGGALRDGFLEAKSARLVEALQAFQKDLNFLLSRDAEVDTKPSLEIYADDVECSHGATAGNMDKNMLFYLQSRGIDKDEATSMLIRGFAQEIIDEFEDENIINALEEILKNKINILDIQGIM